MLVVYISSQRTFHPLFVKGLISALRSMAWMSLTIIRGTSRGTTLVPRILNGLLYLLSTPLSAACFHIWPLWIAKLLNQGHFLFSWNGMQVFHASNNIHTDAVFQNPCDEAIVWQSVYASDHIVNLLLNQSVKRRLNCEPWWANTQCYGLSFYTGPEALQSPIEPFH